MIRSILENAGIKTGTIGTLGILIDNRIYKTNNTTPESYEIQQAMRRMVSEGCKAMVVEASSLGLKWHRTDGILFDYGIFTNFSSDHIGDSEHKDMAEYLACKALLFQRCKTGIINIDDENGEAGFYSIETWTFYSIETRASIQLTHGLLFNSKVVGRSRAFT